MDTSTAFPSGKMDRTSAVNPAQNDGWSVENKRRGRDRSESVQSPQAQIQAMEQKVSEATGFL